MELVFPDLGRLQDSSRRHIGSAIFTLGTGMELVQEDSGYGIVRSISSSIEDGFDIEGVESIK